MSRWLQPTLEVVGLHGGHTGEGTRGVVVAQALAKLMCRLAPGQSGAAVSKAIEAHVKAHAPAHTNFTLTAVASNGRLLTEPYSISKDAPGNKAAAKVQFTTDVLLGNRMPRDQENQQLHG